MGCVCVCVCVCACVRVCVCVSAHLIDEAISIMFSVCPSILVRVWAEVFSSRLLVCLLSAFWHMNMFSMIVMLCLLCSYVVYLCRPRLGNSLHHVLLVGVVYLVLGSFEGIRRVITVIMIVISYLPNCHLTFICTLPFASIFACVFVYV